jgi:hypothetical protein
MIMPIEAEIKAALQTIIDGRGLTAIQHVELVRRYVAARETRIVALILLCRDALTNLRLHDSEYHHRTPPDLLERLKAVTE